MSEVKMGTEKNIDIKHYYYLLKKRIWYILAFSLICAVFTGIFSVFYLKPVYQASTKLIVNKKEDSVSIQQIDLNSVNTNIKLIDTYKEIIKTPAIMQKVIDTYPKFKKYSAEQLIGKVKVNSVNNTQVMTVSVNDFSYPNAVELANAISKVFQNEIKNIMKIDNVYLLNEAKVLKNQQPVSTSPLFNIIISVLLSFLLGMTVLFVMDYLDDTLKNEEDVRKFLNLPTLSMIPRTRDEDLEPKSNRVRKEVGETLNV